MTFITSINWHSFLLILILHNLGKGGRSRKGEKKKREKESERKKRGGVKVRLVFRLSSDKPANVSVNRVLRLSNATLNK